MKNYDELKTKLEKYGQEHMLRFWDELNNEEKQNLTKAISIIDFDKIDELGKLLNEEKKLDKDIKQASYISLTEEEEDASLLQNKDNFHHKMHTIGQDLLRQGKVCAFVVAGGQGTRLGYPKPKGTYPIGPITENSLFQFHFEKLKAMEEKYNTEIPFLIMTSEMTHNDTINYLEEKNYFGYNKDNVHIFQQGKMPAVDKNGKILLSRKDYPAFSPNGHGGSVFALRDSGVLDKLIKKGIEYIFYFQVDNLMVRICEPYFFGCHHDKDSDISVKILEKAYPEEKLGVYVINKGKPFIIEYSDLTKEESFEKDDDGRLKYRLGSHAIHILSVKFIKKFTDKYKHLPYHKAVKKIPYVNEKGEKIKPSEPNGVKFEMFIFDILPHSTVDKVTVVEGIRSREFAPLKNKTGKDSLETAHKSFIEDCARRLKNAGVKDIPRKENGELKYKLELSPYFIVFSDKLKEKIKKIKTIDSDLFIGE
jgi:UDP-N-acetylglucosamine/UDP-N-acetylgalactosamine diphosphorylase